jgi:hypothetical protein
MIGPTTPVAERPDWHPVHRANALLEAAMLSSAQAEPSEGRHYQVESLSEAIASVMNGPVNITYPTPLAARLDALDAGADAFPPFEVLIGAVSARNAGPALAGLDEPIEVEADLPAEEFPADDFPGDDFPAEEVWDDDAESIEERAPLTADAPLDPEKWALTPQVHVEALLREFQRRQRHASWLVAGSIATAVALTLSGLFLVASLAAPRPADSGQLPSVHSTSVVWQRPAVAPAPRLALNAIDANRSAKSEPLPAPVAAQSEISSAVQSTRQTILAASGREIAFGALLPPSHARYLFIRGLPPEAKLSAGRDSGNGAWLVKAEYLQDLTLALGQTAAGDYPIEVYELESGDGPQARRNFVLRVEPPAAAYASAAAPAWASALLDVVPSAHAAEEPTVPAESPVLRDRARQLLDIGDIAGARLLLLHLAERGDGEAAYDLARTFDRDALTELGARGLDGDLTQARDWYQRASQDGIAKATERLKILASLSGSGPSD